MRPHSILLLIASLLFIPVIATADCPTNQVSQGCGFEGWSGYSAGPSAMFEFTLVPGVAAWTAGTACPTACYDLTQGLLVSNGHYGPYDDCSAVAETHDVYQIAGLPPGGPYSFTAELWVTGSIYGNGKVSARFGLEGQLPSENSSTVASMSYKLIVPLSRSVGEPFGLTAWLLSQGFSPLISTAHGEAVIHFSGLPQGGFVVSCQSYDLPVPAERLTWGGLKATYR